MYGEKILTKPEESDIARPFPSGQKLQATVFRESFTEEGHLSELGLKDGLKTGHKGIGGRKSGGKKGMEVGILLQRGG